MRRFCSHNKECALESWVWVLSWFLSTQDSRLGKKAGQLTHLFDTYLVDTHLVDTYLVDTPGIDFHGKLVGVQWTPTLLIFGSPQTNLGVHTFSTAMDSCSAMTSETIGFFYFYPTPCLSTFLKQHNFVGFLQPTISLTGVRFSKSWKVANRATTLQSEVAQQLLR